MASSCPSRNKDRGKETASHGEDNDANNTFTEISKTVLRSKYPFAESPKGNLVWAAPMVIAWDRLKEISKTTAVQLVDNNIPDATQKTLAALNSFPLGDLKVDDEICKTTVTRSLEQIIIKTILSVAPQFRHPFEPKNVAFNGKQVQGIGDGSALQRDNVKIIHYESDDRFIIRLELKDTKEQLILAKGYHDQIDTVMEIVNSTQQEACMESMDSFLAPKLDLKLKKVYKDFIGRGVEGVGPITKMEEKIQFGLNEVGVKLRAEAEIILGATCAPPWENVPKPKPKHLHLNKPFLLLMKRELGKEPYFILDVKNTEWMQSAQ